MHPAQRALSGLGRLRRGLGANVDTSQMIQQDDGSYFDPTSGNYYSSGGHLLDPTTGLPIVGSLTPAAPPAATGVPLVQSSYLDASGNTIIPLQGGGYRSIAPSGNSAQFDTAPPPPATGVSAAQTAAAIAKALQWSGPANPFAYAPTSQTFSQWASANSSMLLIGGAVFFGVVMLMGRR